MTFARSFYILIEREGAAPLSEFISVNWVIAERMAWVSHAQMDERRNAMRNFHSPRFVRRPQYKTHAHNFWYLSIPHAGLCCALHWFLRLGSFLWSCYSNRYPVCSACVRFLAFWRLWQRRPCPIWLHGRFFTSSSAVGFVWPGSGVRSVLVYSWAYLDLAEFGSYFITAIKRPGRLWPC